MFRKIFNKIRDWLKFWLWVNPTAKDKPLKATEVVNDYVCIDYKGQLITLRKGELPVWNKMGRVEKRKMAFKFAKLQKSGAIRFEKINNRMVCIKNKHYEKRKNNGEPGDGEIGSGKRPGKYTHGI